MLIYQYVLTLGSPTSSVEQVMTVTMECIGWFSIFSSVFFLFSFWILWIAYFKTVTICAACLSHSWGSELRKVKELKHLLWRHRGHCPRCLPLLSDKNTPTLQLQALQSYGKSSKASVFCREIASSLWKAVNRNGWMAGWMYFVGNTKGIWGSLYFIRNEQHRLLVFFIYFNCFVDKNLTFGNLRVNPTNSFYC